MTNNFLSAQNKTIYLGGGCFWCIEAIFNNLKGVIHTESGYAGGELDNPTYEKVSKGNTGHAEVVKITYNPKVIPLSKILEIYWYMHNPTTPNRQGADKGGQYRSIVLYDDNHDLKIIETAKQRSIHSGIWEERYTTNIQKLKRYYKAEEYHQNYYMNHKNQPYCNYTIAPKIDKFKKKFKDWLK